MYLYKVYMNSLYMHVSLQLAFVIETPFRKILVALKRAFVEGLQSAMML